MASSCCLALVVVLAIIIIAVFWVEWYIASRISAFYSAEGPLAVVSANDDINYTSYLPAQLPDPDKFDINLATFAIRTCESATNRRIGGGTQLPPGLAEVGWTNGHALVLKTTPPPGGGVFVVAVAGTITHEDVRSDSDVQLVEFYGARAHAGFVGAWANTYPAIKKIVAANLAEKFIITGHSLGAAVATLVATALSIDFPGIQIALYAFATPRAGSKAFVDLLTQRVPNSWHIVNRSDIVPTLPPSVVPIISGPDRGKNAIYANYNRIIFFDHQSGSLVDNHLAKGYLCGLAGGKACPYWTAAPRAVTFA
jgi:hypothetical protein